MASRKRRAPGASPQVQQQPGIQAYPQDIGNMSSEPYLNNWGDSSMMGDLNAGDAFNSYGNTYGLGGAAGPSHNRIVSLDGQDDPMTGADLTSGQLVRRNPNQQLAARGRSAWDAFDSNGQQDWENNEDDDETLEQKALLAKKDAQAKRKQIPPFVQKLNSFLDDNKNSNLIRWSDDGNSFIVIDEDEFARTLIPELFKHKNYASFVRQLNMYGFHKKVGLSDNSMKASETKAKAPSEYYNKYFKRGRPELLWLIQKPKNPTSAPKRKRDDDIKQGDSDDDRKYVQDGSGGQAYADDLTVRGNQDMAIIPRTEYNNLRNEVRALQQQQKVISGVLGQIRRQNDQLYQQATAFQTLHDRHENSINAILTFLATFYNRTLEGNNPPNLADMFGPAIPQHPPQGSVVDVGDFPEKPFSQAPQIQRQTRRPLALLPAPAVKETDRAATLSPSVRSAAASPSSQPPSRQSVFKSPSVRNRPAPSATNVGNQSSNLSASPIQPKVESLSPPNTQQLGSLPENDEVMSAIQNANANTSQSGTQAPQFDFPAALANYQAQGGNTPLTQQQRNDVLSMMANNASAASPHSALAQNSNNAMVNPQPPAMPDLSQFAETQAQLDFLQKMSEEQGSRVQSLQERLQPLSPSGSIPGLTDDGYFGNAHLGDPGQYDLNHDLDLDSFVQGDDFFPSNNQNGPTGTGDVTLPDLDFNLPDPNQDISGTNLGGAGAGDGSGFLRVNDNTNEEGGRIESISSAATSPTVTVEDADDDSSTKRSPKRRRK